MDANGTRIPVIHLESKLDHERTPHGFPVLPIRDYSAESFASIRVHSRLPGRPVKIC